MKRLRLILILLILVVLFGSAAYLGGQLFRTATQAQDKANQQDGPRKLVTPAAGMPQEPPTARGDVQSRDGNVLVLCDTQESMSINPDGTVNQDTECSPTFQVVLEHDTQFLHDVTSQQYPKPDKSGEDYIIRQAITAGSADDIATATAVRAWGEVRGDRVIAHTVLYWNRAPHTVKGQ